MVVLPAGHSFSRQPPFSGYRQGDKVRTSGQDKLDQETDCDDGWTLLQRTTSLHRMNDAWQEIWDRAVERHSEELVQRAIPTVLSSHELSEVSDDRCLAAMAKAVFAAGFRWRVVEAKWPGFEAAFAGFDPSWVAGLDEEDEDALAQDTRIVRNPIKIDATIENAHFVSEIAANHGSFGRWLATWRPDQTLELWEAMRAGGTRLGGATGGRVLRLIGRDTFLFTNDVCAALVEAGVVPKKPTGKRLQRAAQDAICQWSNESGLSLAGVSMVLSMSTGSIRRRRPSPARS